MFLGTHASSFLFHRLWDVILRLVLWLPESLPQIYISVTKREGSGQKASTRWVCPTIFKSPARSFSFLAKTLSLPARELGKCDFVFVGFFPHLVASPFKILILLVFLLWNNTIIIFLKMFCQPNVYPTKKNKNK